MFSIRSSAVFPLLTTGPRLLHRDLGRGGRNRKRRFVAFLDSEWEQGERQLNNHFSTAILLARNVRRRRRCYIFQERGYGEFCVLGAGLGQLQRILCRSAPRQEMRRSNKISDSGRVDEEERHRPRKRQRSGFNGPGR